MPRRAIVTVVTRNYAHYARVLAQSCRTHQPDCDFFVCYADRPPSTWQESVAGTQVIYGDELNIDAWHRFSFQYTPFELSCALKPFAIAALIKRDYEEVIYLDGDMTVYGPLTEVLRGLERGSIVLTPHLLRPLPSDGNRPDESAFLISGAFNAGFLAVRAGDTTEKFIQWWQDMCRRKCIVDLAASLFADQKWLDLVPGMFPGVHILRNPGYNAGHWSFSQFTVEAADPSPTSSSGVHIGEHPLVLFHFSGMTPGQPHAYLKSQTRTSLAAYPALERLVRKYHSQLTASGMAMCTSWGCEFDTLSDGTVIHPAWREAIRQPHRRLAHVQNPFDLSAHPEVLPIYLSLQSVAHKWRRDWRLQWSKEQGIAGRVRKANSRLKSFFSGLRQLRRSA